ncbi:high-potential iron-sulfur protein [Parapedobacter tibetensis]|uniref:high-potential iron-sulfur protein n=1 Tax=Parapedobacter tibetensis TaxID=2972951 RepID=UPI002152C4B2|nr:high-potential iron-sulfur protein [Parapedobacter tibetensis]
MNTRRYFLHKLIATGFYFLAGSTVLSACKGGNKRSQENGKEASDRFGGNCGDFSKLTEGDFQTRKKLGYVEKSPAEDTQCQYCNLWLPPKENQTCGGCTLFAGPIEAEGTCTYWVPRQQ